MNNLVQEQSNQALVDALKYTSDIIITLTEKINSQDNKIGFLEKTIIEQKNIISKNQNDILELNKKISILEKSVLLFISNKSNLINKTNNKSNNQTNNQNNIEVEFDFLTQTLQELGSNLDNFDNIDNLDSLDDINNILGQDKIDLKTINNTICNSTMISDITSFNNEEINKIKKQKVSNIIENLIKKKEELDNKISGNGNTSGNTSGGQTPSTVLTNNPNVVIEENIKTDNKSIDINAMRRKKNFARKF